MPDVLDAVRRRRRLGFVPIENSIEGIVNLTQDALAFDHDLLIQREVVLDIEHCLVGRPGTSLDDVKVVLSIPVATAQCHRFLRERLSGRRLHAANSTAEAARWSPRRTDTGLAAIAPRVAAELYGLEVLADDIADHDGNQTRFVVVARDGSPAADRARPHGVVVFQRADEPGSLISILQEFAARRINLSTCSAARPRTAGSATTASSSTPTATSPTSWWPTPCASARQAGRGEVPRLVPRGGAHAGSARSTPTPAGVRPTTGCRRCAHHVVPPSHVTPARCAASADEMTGYVEVGEVRQLCSQVSNSGASSVSISWKQRSRRSSATTQLST